MKFFKQEEFDSPDKPGSGAKMKPHFLKMLIAAREQAKIPFIITSGYRTRAHNKRVGGVNGSSHTKGVAVDLRCKDSKTRSIIINAAIAVGFTRIGISDRFIHIDADDQKVQNVIWMY
ncbi:D-Ala-D-Ala carboxypeptidase family metallohydrolase [Spongiivirga citrea]|uniref:Peptidase M15 n=1 Tax=Spongiivirga citrea TaxID=1481457 RepID=A0A6M0CQX1_9FLAO|nr:D-Ala-D-Ala carboxypeptidase family metallohydrolase [Spongiivirga citrea]NER16330.1 peptidase M15 [Spongiivirga citrea]